MKKCLVCGKKLRRKEEKICSTCKDFFKYKYGSKFKKEIKRFIEEKSFSIKFRRAK